MLRSLLSNSLSSEDIVYYVLLIPIVLFSLTIHEYAHGYAAKRCGDGTAEAFGRLTLNPAKHLDPIGALMMLLVGFGWAKPAPVNMNNLNKPKRDIGIVSFAGPLANFTAAFIATVVYTVAFRFLWTPNVINTALGTSYYEAAKTMIVGGSAPLYLDEFSKAGLYTLTFIQLMIILNIGLGVFNLIPIPPLDGSKILASVLPNKYAAKYMNMQDTLRFVLLILVLSSWVPLRVGGFANLSDLLFFPIDFLREGLVKVFFYGINLIPILPH